jgi:rSAM/selenodomain-associated transferase 1
MPSSGLPTHLAVFAKYWEPGEVKTRLGATIGAPAAAAIHREFLREILHLFCDTADVRTLVFWPPERKAEFQEFVPSQWGLSCQSIGDLGSKLSTFMKSRFSAMRERVVVIGADSPDLPRDFLGEAFERLREHRVVLGPSLDGGYYLVGQNSYLPIFDDIAWSTDSVFSQTVDILRRRGIDHSVLKPWEDVDNLPSLLSLQRRLGENAADPKQARLFERLRTILGSVAV